MFTRYHRYYFAVKVYLRVECTEKLAEGSDGAMREAERVVEYGVCESAWR